MQMKTTLALICFYTIFVTQYAYCEDWEITGKTYHNVTVSVIEADRVHISYDGGVGTIQIADMPPELKAKFQFDAVKAKATKDARDLANAEENALLARSIPVTVTMPNAVPAPTVETKPPAIDRAAVQAQLAAAQAQLTEDQRLMIHDMHDAGNYTKSIYPAKVADDQARIAQLQSQLK